MMNNIVTVSASDARADLYNLIKKAAQGRESYEIVLRGSEPVIMMSRREIGEWMETLDVMSSPDEVRAIRESAENSERISLDELLSQSDNDKYGNFATKKSRDKAVQKAPRNRKNKN